jgi:hypothetical protein
VTSCGPTGAVLWNGNRERLWWHAVLWSERSLYSWLFATFWRDRREFPALFREPAHAHARVVHLWSPRAARAWLALGCPLPAMRPRQETDR